MVNCRMAYVCLCVSSLLPGCIEGFDSANGSDEAYYRLYDYTIDRPRVMSVQYWPLDFSGGDIVTFQALAATPDQPTGARVEWWGCGATVDQPFSYYGTDCLETSIAEYLGEGEALTMTMPDYDTTLCEPTEGSGEYPYYYYYGGCYGFIPIFAIVSGDPDEEPDRGYGVTFISPDYLDTYDDPPQSDLHEASITFKVGNGNTTSATASPGEGVSLEAIVQTLEPDLQFSWYVSDGTLDDLGITRAAEVVLGDEDEPNVVYGRNTLRVPEDSEGSTLYVYLVIDSTSYYYYGLERAVTGTVQVNP